ncbi:unnamed protein product [Meloidogyne enterolobii]|uniref:Uncharacterized protein n=1 Tax=Meloidogyne enterolobii TaxID=390850 RepID=A0ACB0Z6N5_MELEN
MANANIGFSVTSCFGPLYSLERNGLTSLLSGQQVDGSESHCGPFHHIRLEDKAFTEEIPRVPKSDGFS